MRCQAISTPQVLNWNIKRQVHPFKLKISVTLIMGQFWAPTRSIQLKSEINGQQREMVWIIEGAGGIPVQSHPSGTFPAISGRKQRQVQSFRYVVWQGRYPKVNPDGK